MKRITKELIDQDINILKNTDYKIFDIETAEYYVSKTYKAIFFLDESLKTERMQLNLWEKGYNVASSFTNEFKAKYFFKLLGEYKYEFLEHNTGAKGNKDIKSTIEGVDYLLNDNSVGFDGVLQYIKKYPNFGRYFKDDCKVKSKNLNDNQQKIILDIYYKYLKDDFNESLNFINGIKKQFQ